MEENLLLPEENKIPDDEILLPAEEILTCPYCHAPIKNDAHFCPSCGKNLKFIATENNPFKTTALRSVLIFYGILFGALMFIHFNDSFSDYHNLMWVEIALAAIVFLFAALNWKEIFPLLSFRKIKLWRILLVMLFSSAASLLVSKLIGMLNLSLNGIEAHYYYSYSTFYNPGLVMIYSIALYPAIIEELAFRGFVFNHMKKLSGSTATIIFSSFLFSVLHLSFLSFFWLLPFAIFQGYMRNRYNTLWYGVASHFAFNFTVVVSEIIHFHLM